MKRINKTDEPISLTNFKINNPNSIYSDLENGNVIIRQDIRESCVREQYFLCAYCCDRIDFISCHNEHIIPQTSPVGRNLTLDYNNIVASCESKKHCGHKKENNIINITPLLTSCETEIVYKLNGKMTHRSQNSQSTINILNLRDRGLVNKRKNVIDIILFQYVEDLSELALENSEYLEMIIEEILQPDADGKLEAFTPVIKNVLKQFLA